MIIEYPLPHTSFISSYIITYKTVNLYFVNSDRHIVQQTRTRGPKD